MKTSPYMIKMTIDKAKVNPEKRFYELLPYMGSYTEAEMDEISERLAQDPK